MSGVAGYSAVVTVGGSTVGKARDVQASFETTLADASTRDGAGFRGKCPCLSGCSVTIDQLYVSSDAAVSAIEAAWLGKSLVAVTLAVGDGGSWSFNGYIGTLDKGEPIDDVETLGCTIDSDGLITGSGGS